MLSPFELAESFVNFTSRNVFLTGKAGTGKTTFLRKIIQHTSKNAVVVAPTGVAAINAGGTTMHSLFQLPFGCYTPTDSYSYMDGAHNRYSVLKNLRMNNNKRKLIKELELLIIDEISMVRADMLDATDAILQHIRMNDQPFGGVQVLFIGDLFQLPPVVTDRDKSTIESYYETPYFFSAQVMHEADLINIELKTIYRQSDEQFIQLLNSIRDNDVNEDQLNWLNEKCVSDFDPSEEGGYITLTTHNRKADTINVQKLNEIGESSYKYKAIVTGDFSENAYPVAEELELKEGAQVIFMRNDTKEERRYYNGKIGVVSSLSNDSVFVRFPEEDVELEVEKFVWKNMTYAVNDSNNEIEEVELGSFTQYPLKLAWAITIHKSQGLTFAKAVVDAGASFSPGQVYVALSRLETYDGLILKSPISYRNILSNEAVSEFSQQAERKRDLSTLLEREQELFITQSLSKCFYWESLEDHFQDHFEYVATAKIGFQDTAQSFIAQWRKTIREQKQIAFKFDQELNGLLELGEQAYPKIAERIQKAFDYFAGGLEEQVLTPILLHYKEVKGKKGAKKYMKSLAVLVDQVKIKQQQLFQAKFLSEGLVKGVGAQELLQKANQERKKLLEKAESESIQKNKVDSKKLSLEKFLSGQTVYEIAKERELAVSTIEGHLIGFITTGELTLDQLVSEEKVAKILPLVEEGNFETTTEIKKKLDTSISYTDIRAVINHVRSQSK